jgi:hypothetical protein
MVSKSGQFSEIGDKKSNFTGLFFVVVEKNFIFKLH